MIKKNKKIVIAYLSGPIDAGAVYDVRKEGVNQFYFGTSYLSQFYDILEDRDYAGFVITSLPGEKNVTFRENLKIQNLPQSEGVKGIWYHILAILWVIKVTFLIIAERPARLIITDAQNYWFLMFPVRLLGIKITAAYHCTLWPPYQKLKLHQRLLLALNGMFLRFCVQSAATASQTISEQVRAVVADKTFGIEEFLPTYDRKHFANVRPQTSHRRSPFNVVFAGRVECNKGIYDFFEMARVLTARYPQRFNFHICGEGTELENVKITAASPPYDNNVFVHGFCAQAKMIDILSLSHVIVVPTRSDFEEGFAMICAEAILAGRPLVTSAACPALTVLKPATIEARVDDVSSYISAIEQLATNAKTYETKRLACEPLQQQFFEIQNSWYKKISKAILK